jgi:hypothetical protein
MCSWKNWVKKSKKTTGFHKKFSGYTDKRIKLNKSERIRLYESSHYKREQHSPELFKKKE